jgi:hypothetical protein
VIFGDLLSKNPSSRTPVRAVFHRTLLPQEFAKNLHRRSQRSQRVRKAKGGPSAGIETL